MSVRGYVRTAFCPMGFKSRIRTRYWIIVKHVKFDLPTSTGTFIIFISYNV